MGSTFYSKRLVGSTRKISRARSNRPKTFKTLEAAKAWAASNNLKEYKIVNLRVDEASSHPKFRVVAAE